MLGEAADEKTVIRMMNRVRELLRLLRAPRLSVYLMVSAARENDPFYERLVEDFVRDANKRHKRLPLLPAFSWGVAIGQLPDRAGEYVNRIESSGKRNYKKALRMGYTFERIEYNRHLDDVRNILGSTHVRQGAFPAEELVHSVHECKNPPSRSNIHDYPYFGVLKDGRLRAYAACLVAGELMLIEHIYGHAAVQADGVVPMLLVSMADYARTHYPCVRYYAYGSYFGAGANMRRFKRKFNFEPRHVLWVSDRGPDAGRSPG